MDVVPFEPEHLETIMLQPAQQRFFTMFTPEYAAALQKMGPAFTGIKDGEILGCAGVIKQWENRAVAWSLLSGNIGNDFVSIHKAVSRFLDMTEFNRIEAYVDAKFDAGHRWIKMLGFHSEGRMEQFNPDGSDAVMYARLRNG